MGGGPRRRRRHPPGGYLGGALHAVHRRHHALLISCERNGALRGNWKRQEACLKIFGALPSASCVAGMLASTHPPPIALGATLPAGWIAPGCHSCTPPCRSLSQRPGKMQCALTAQPAGEQSPCLPHWGRPLCTEGPRTWVLTPQACVDPLPQAVSALAAAPCGGRRWWLCPLPTFPGGPGRRVGGTGVRPAAAIAPKLSCLTHMAKWC